MWVGRAVTWEAMKESFSSGVGYIVAGYETQYLAVEYLAWAIRVEAGRADSPDVPDRHCRNR